MAPKEDRRSERFGRYEILSELGRGAMGVVYKARDPKINRVVAVKTVSLAGQAPEEEREYRERFIREAEAAGRLSHPGIVTIFDVGEEPGTRAPYIVMEFVGGQSLDEYLSDNHHKLPVEKALQLTLELAEALDCAHGQGVVHRDLKPANILLTPDGHAKIADFGIAKLNLANQTLAGRALGTPAYMSPEQLNGDPVDGRSDLFSLGVVLYTILTGYRPFQGNSAVTVSFKVVNREPIAASLLDTELPPGLDYIIARAMAKDPAERYQRGMELVLDIQELRAGREPWSKAKLPASPAIRGAAAKAGKEQGGVALGEPWTLAELVQSARNVALARKIRGTSVAGRFAAVALLLFGVWAISFATHRMLPRTGAPVPARQMTAPAKDETAAVAPPPVPEPQLSVSQPNVSQPATAQAMPQATDGPLLTPAPSSAPSTVMANANHSPKPRPAPAKTLHVAVQPSSPVSLMIEVYHKFAEAQLTIWVDDRLAYTHQLEGTDKKHLVLFHQVQGHEFHAMQISPGKHHLKVQVTSDATRYTGLAAVTGDFVSGHENVLRVNFSKSGGMNAILE